MEPVKPPMGNRVEDLEKQVAELQAAVDGLTEELVESKERLRQLEKGESTEPTTERSTGKGGARDAEFVANADAQSADEDESSEADANAEAEADDGGEADDDDSDGIIVA